MKTVTVTNRSREMKTVLRLAKKEAVVVRTPDGDEFMLSWIDDFDHEIAAQRRNQKLMAFLDRRFRQARQEQGIPLKEVERSLGLDSRGAKGSRRKARSNPR
jgi:hypothetical protein